MTGENVAIKLKELSDEKVNNLKQEAKMLKKLQSVKGVPLVYFDGEEGDYYVLVMELLGPNLKQLHRRCGYRFTHRTALYLGLQVMQIVEKLHQKGVFHRNINLENLCIGRDNQ